MAIEFHPRIWQVLLLLVIAVGLGVFVIWPAIVGYTVYQEVQKTNYSVDQYGQTLGGLSLDLEKAKTNLSSYSLFNTQLLQQVKDVTSDVKQCEWEKGKLETQVESLTTFNTEKEVFWKQQLQEKDDLVQTSTADKEKAIQDITNQKEKEISDIKATQEKNVQASIEQCRKDSNAISNQLQTLQAEYTAFIQTMAKSVCCKQKVDDSRINSYEVIAGKMLCLQDGKNSLSC